MIISWMYFLTSDGQVNIRIKQFVGKVNIQVIDINGRVVYSVKNEDLAVN
jgi:hypothetical protein